MIVRRFTVEIHQEIDANHPGQISDDAVMKLINKRLGHLVHGTEPIHAIAVYRDSTSPAPEIGTAVEQSWLPWNHPPHGEQIIMD